MLQHIGEQIRRLRNAHDWTQEQFAQRLNVSRSKVSKWENGEVLPDLQSVIDMSNIFRVSVDFLLGKHPTDEQLLQEVRLAYGTNEMSDEQLSVIRYMNEQRELAKRLYALQSLPLHKRKRVEEVIIKMIDEMIKALK
ncbi:XRE family transcriptional regulator [Anoxybacillus flavithermus]|uniref:XRE family transcriptional regulator n=2 Tax=Anoxybacillus TaxID=150247 RepID=A0A2G5RNV6_9BACL|nr:helix-turn-helix transcriptional regulator [Anoxybacillus flavithermus]KFZ41693.1 XRE family transcriptional regulator [Anoxybacillus sp. KU2-6(11)]PIC04341.1 XRE family transcriptional regulator [Anoxybacillus flavithermus]